jgi:hypothetical protein
VGSKKSKIVIMISGTPGAGKSTVAIYLVNYLRKVNFRVKLVSITSLTLIVYIFLYLIGRLTYKRGNFHELIKGHAVHPIVLIEASLVKRMIKLITFLEALSIHISFLLKIYIPLKLNYNLILIDEGSINIIGNYYDIFLSKIPNKKVFYKLTMNVLKLTKKTSHENTFKVFFLDADDCTLMDRWKFRGMPTKEQQIFDNYLLYLRYLRYAKNLFERELDMKVINLNTSSKKVSEVAKDILNKLEYWNI